MRQDFDERRQTIVPPPNNTPYIVAVVLMMFLGVSAVSAIAILRPDKDNTTLITTIVGFIAPTTLSLLAFMKAQETHLSVNSRLDAFIGNAKLASRAQGLDEGRIQGRLEANERTDALAASAPAVQTPADVKLVEAPVLVVPPK